MLRFPPAEYEWPSTSRSSKTSNVMTEDHEDHDNFHQNHQIHLGLLRLHRPHHPSASTTDLLPYPADKTPNAPYSPNVSWFPPLLPTDGRVQGIRWYPDDEEILDLDFENTRTGTVRPRDTCSFDVDSTWLSISGLGADHDSDGRMLMLSQPKTDSVEDSLLTTLFPVASSTHDSEISISMPVVSLPEVLVDVEESESLPPLPPTRNHTSGSTTEASSSVPVGVPPFLLPSLSREGTPSSSSMMMMMMILDNNDSTNSNDSTQRPKTNHRPNRANRANRANRPSPPGVLVSSPRQSHTGSNRTTTTSTLSNPGPRPDPPSSFSSPFSNPNPFSSLATYQNTDTENTSERVPAIPIPSYDTPSSYGFGSGSSFSSSSNLPNPKSDERYPSYPHKLPHRPHKPHNSHTHKSARYSPYPNNPNPPIQIQPIQRRPNPPPPRLDRSYRSYRLPHTPTPGSTKGLMEYTIEFSHTNNTPEDEARFLAQVEGRRAREVKREVNRQRREMKREMRVGMDRQGRDGNLNWNGGYDYRRRLSLTSNM
ncbi:hypothetical protein F5878DRAFT_663182 [Lentinula raphanica]|uniref:Uncharacterized protein n=1 Tax=Lentinula raphanica TaxID=153919 RepID=A0AA38UBA4_9AGAR|nr:hypothetical protein F5878DRAFT_663182 [Lentinula raphanica]